MIVVEAVDRARRRGSHGLPERGGRGVLREYEGREREERDAKHDKRQILVLPNASLHVCYYIVPSMALA